MSDARLKRRLELEKMMGVDALVKGGAGAVRAEAGPPPAKEAPGEVAAALASIEEEVRRCTKCPLHRTRTQGVFARGRCDAELMFIGEGPGAEEDRLGQPFVGRAGKLLDKMIEAMGLGRDDAYVANIVKSRAANYGAGGAPENRPPTPDEIRACWPYLERQIQLVKPRIIVTLGAPASNTLLGRDASMADLRGRWFSYEGIPVLPTYHPAYLLRSPGEKAKAWQDLKKVVLALRGVIKPEPTPTGLF